MTGDDALVPKLRFRPEFEDRDISNKPVHELKKLLNQAEGRMVLHETQLFQLEEVQGELLKSGEGKDAAQKAHEVNEQRDIEREKMRSALVDVQIISETLVRAFNARQARQMGISVEEFMQSRRHDHEVAIMPWHYPKKDLSRIRISMTVGVVVGLVVALLIPTVEVPPKLVTKTVIPERLASLVIDRKKKPPPPPPPTLKPKKEEKKPEAKKPELKKETRIKPPPRVEKPQTAERKQAREKVRKKLAQTTNVLQKLATASSSALQKIGKTSGLTTGGSKSRRSQRKIITTRSGSGSGGIKVSRTSRSTGNVGSGVGAGGAGAGGAIQSNIDVRSLEQAKAAELQGQGDTEGRSQQEIQIVFDKNQSRIFRIYQKGLRANPALRGRVVFELTIAPDGTVTECRVLSSDMGAPKIEQAIAKRIKLMKFPPKPGGKPYKTKYPIDFLPS